MSQSVSWDGVSPNAMGAGSNGEKLVRVRAGARVMNLTLNEEEWSAFWQSAQDWHLRTRSGEQMVSVHKLFDGFPPKLI